MLAPVYMYKTYTTRAIAVPCATGAHNTCASETRACQMPPPPAPPAVPAGFRESRVLRTLEES